MYSFLYLMLLRGTQVFVIIRLHFVLSIFLYLSICLYLSVLYFIMYKTKNRMNVNGNTYFDIAPYYSIKGRICLPMQEMQV